MEYYKFVVSDNAVSVISNELLNKEYFNSWEIISHSNEYRTFDIYPSGEENLKRIIILDSKENNYSKLFIQEYSCKSDAGNILYKEIATGYIDSQFVTQIKNSY